MMDIWIVFHYAISSKYYSASDSFPVFVAVFRVGVFGIFLCFEFFVLCLEGVGDE
jgi:hypothetical protein